MKLKALSILLSAGIMAACSGSHESGKSGTVNVADAIANPSEITTSQLGSKIRFVPLETSDSALIGNAWTMAFTDDGYTAAKSDFICRIMALTRRPD